MRASHYSTVAEMVQNRVQQNFDMPGNEQHRPVTVRLSEQEIAELDLLTAYLGYPSRQQLMAQLLATSIEDALQTVSDALESDVEAHQEFTQERLRIVEEYAAGG